MTLRETRGENRWESFGLWVACRRFWGQPSSAAEPFVKATSGKNFSARFSAGFSVKFINDKLADTRAGAFAVDFGTNFHATIGERPIRAAFVLQNLGSQLRHDGPGLDAGVSRTPPLGTPDVPQEPQPARLRASGWDLPVLFRVSVALDLYNRGANRITIVQVQRHAHAEQDG